MTQPPVRRSISMSTTPGRGVACGSAASPPLLSSFRVFRAPRFYPHNHMGVTGALHSGGYYLIGTAGWPANLQIPAFHQLFSQSTTVIGVNNAKDMHCSTLTLRFHRWQNWQQAWQSDASARREEQRQRAKRQSVGEQHMHMKTDLSRKSRGCHGISTQLPHRIVHSTSE